LFYVVDGLSKRFGLSKRPKNTGHGNQAKPLAENGLTEIDINFNSTTSNFTIFLNKEVTQQKHFLLHPAESMIKPCSQTWLSLWTKVKLSQFIKETKRGSIRCIAVYK